MTIRNAANTSVIVFGMTHSWVEQAFFRSWTNNAYHYTNEADTRF